MDYTAAQPALVAWVKALTGLEVVAWENEPRPHVPAGRLGVLSWLPTAGRGVDEVRWEDSNAVAPLPNLEPTVVGVRVLGLQVSVETLDQRPEAPHARATLERMRDRLRRPSSLAALAAANLGLIGAGDVAPADYRVDKRWVSRSVLDVRFNATSFDRDTDGAAPAIETVRVTSHIADVDGTELPAPEQFNDEVMPA